MQQSITAGWVEHRVTETAELWRASAWNKIDGPCYSEAEQDDNEAAYDEALWCVEREIKSAPFTERERITAHQRILNAFARFSASALNLPNEAIQLLTAYFIPVGSQLASSARAFDPGLSMPEIVQACRNAWTACGLQPLLGETIRLTPAIFAYSLLYPYSDNLLDAEDLGAAEKLHFSQRFEQRLRGIELTTRDHRERAVWLLVEMIETQFPRHNFPQVFESLLAIHQAQEGSLRQTHRASPLDETTLLRLSCGKGGTSVLADACLARGWLTAQETQFAFEWGVLLQLGDDLQDVHEDLRRGSMTLFSTAAAAGQKLDGLAAQLLRFSTNVEARLCGLPEGSETLKKLLIMSWRSLIIRAIADSSEFFSPEFVAEAELRSPFRFDFLRSRQRRLVNQSGLYATLFEVFLETAEVDSANVHR